ncbi:Casp-like protein 4a3 [Thalictrum thalictroides]|uniref:CASP-like protein n=1 Tax=Thalictrum thalictroides TaxID=46969 RepID=A0A7J6XAV0_THATH|nr:Casp-like protein 4a3 [Thalictrum thalictroides]
MVSIKQEEERPEMESESSPLRSPTPPSSRKSPIHKPLQTPHENLSQIIAADRRIHGFSPLRSPPPLQDTNKIQQHKQPPIQQQQPPIPISIPESIHPLSPVLSPVVVVNRSIREELSAAASSKVENGYSGSGSGGGVARRSADIEDGFVGSGDGDQKSRTVSSILWRERREAMLKRAALGFRVCAFVFCLISFSVMAADKTQGWAGDSFDRYKEYRYCLSVSVIGFVYAGFQAYDLSYNLISGKHVIGNGMRFYFDFSIDQILTYLLISASSAAASRVDDWQSNWGKDDFTVMASASIGMSFLAFVAFAFNSLISGYNLCNRSQA